MKVLVCTGATVPFEEMVTAFTRDVISLLKSAGYDEIVIQYGHARSAFENGPRRFPSVTGFDFAEDIAKHVEVADLVISHAGTGSILDVLRSTPPRKPLVVVVNTRLMNNHQTEVASRLDGRQLLTATEDSLPEVLRRAFTFRFEPLPPPVNLQSVLEEEMAVL